MKIKTTFVLATALLVQAARLAAQQEAAVPNKSSIRRVAFAQSPEQATKVNAFARENAGKAWEWLTPEQRKQIKGGK